MISRSVTSTRLIDVLNESRRLFRRASTGAPVRLLGVHAGGLQEVEEQMNLLDGERTQRWRKALEAVDRMRDKFGESGPARHGAQEQFPRAGTRESGEPTGKESEANLSYVRPANQQLLSRKALLRSVPALQHPQMVEPHRAELDDAGVSARNVALCRSAVQVPLQ